MPFLGFLLNSATPSCHFSFIARLRLSASPAAASAAAGAAGAGAASSSSELAEGAGRRGQRL
jgi:hypothetical protein